MDEYFTELTLLPVCNCGHIIDNLYVEESVEERYGMKNVKVNFVQANVRTVEECLKELYMTVGL